MFVLFTCGCFFACVALAFSLFLSPLLVKNGPVAQSVLLWTLAFGVKINSQTHKDSPFPYIVANLPLFLFFFLEFFGLRIMDLRPMLAWMQLLLGEKFY